jgi:4-amino-4-deoxy-L-arabinose transferase-like glycosyltransferase
LAIVTAAALSIADRDVRWLRGLRPLTGLIATALAVAPWLYAIERATEGHFLAQSLGRDLLPKLVGAEESHGAPPSYYLALAMLTFWPGSLFLAPALIHGWRRRQLPAARFLLAWLVPAWIALELVPTKLPHYVLPLYPALALLAASGLIAETGSAEPRWMRWIGAAVTTLWGLVTLLIAAALIALPLRFAGGIMLSGIAGAVALIALAALLYRRPNPLSAVFVLTVLVLVVPAGSWVVPSLDRLWLSRAAAALIARYPAPSGTKLTVIGYSEPSLVFLLNNDFTTGMADAPVTAGSEALVSDRQAEMFERELAARDLSARSIDSVHGTDYSNGERLTLILYQIGRK